MRFPFRATRGPTVWSAGCLWASMAVRFLYNAGRHVRPRRRVAGCKVSFGSGFWFLGENGCEFRLEIFEIIDALHEGINGALLLPEQLLPQAFDALRFQFCVRNF